MKQLRPLGLLAVVGAIGLAAGAAYELLRQATQLQAASETASQSQTPSPRLLNPELNGVPDIGPMPSRFVPRRADNAPLTRASLDMAPPPVPERLVADAPPPPPSVAVAFPVTPVAPTARRTPAIDLSDTGQPVPDLSDFPTHTSVPPQTAPGPGGGPQVRIQRRGEPTPLDRAELAQQTGAPLYIDPIPSETVRRQPRYFPSLNALAPSGFGANRGDVFIGGALINREVGLGILGPNAVVESDRGKAGGSAAIGFGLGDAEKFVGLETTYNLISLTPSRFAENGSFDFKLHRKLGQLTSIAVGLENAINYGPEAGGTPSSLYGAISTVIPLKPNNPDNPMILGLSAGAGGGRFRTIEDQLAEKDSVGVFGSLGLQVGPKTALITEWSGSSLNLGVSHVPFRRTPLFISATAIDVANNTGYGTRYAISGAYGFNFR